MKVQHIGWKLVACGAFVALCLGIFLMLLRMSGIHFGDGYTLTARFPNGLQLVTNSDVRARGVKVGRVVSIKDHGAQAEVKMSLDKKVLPVYGDAQVQLRTKTLVGENYVDIVPGTQAAGELKSGSRLPVSDAKPSVQLDEILSSLGPKTRAHIRTNIRSLGDGLSGRGGDLNTALASLEPIFGDGGRVMSVLDDERDRVAAVVDKAGDVMQAFGERTDSVRTLAVKLRQTAVAAGSRDAQIRSTLRELPGTLRQAQGSTAKLGAFSRTATPVVADLTDAAGDLAPTVHDLGPAARDTRELVGELKGLLPHSEPLLRGLRSFSDATVPVAPALDSVLRQVNPALTYLAPFHREFGSFFANVGSVIDTRDAMGKIGRVHPVVSETSAAIWTPQMRDALNALLDAGGLSKIHREYNNAYPKPGTIGKPQQFDGVYPQVEAAPPAK
jgi:phospholipid/cholesterol/gamma-HCH transport system substrate-binding protein